ncbi:hypothetical protein Cfla_1391 [Cellulomonas flavigena DSM 20109]|uniref:Lipoprotein n=1 Tax=Cellulomonas flavigena (strain ATCC 482 / DSM 20109 / BCRC 11376 / JCM 18109 / NBRC 3775 / NCIMB 8073 / NRS 134) TaxID=446466 RepID=D5UCH5_CELFN|nr:hypothetical protein [Cellulomonas flavigena]ADG74289.1 hypothetical protein Cfla_1391 [Cellulomonas flavigena DSM 20109]
MRLQHRVVATAALALLALVGCAPTGATRGAEGSGGGRGDGAADRVTLGEDGDVDCAEMLAFVGTSTPLPGEPRCRISAFQDTSYEATTTADPADVEAWLASVQPGAVLPPAGGSWGCPEGVDRCVDLAREPGSTVAWHFLEVEVTGSGADAAVRIAAYNT